MLWDPLLGLINKQIRVFGEKKIEILNKRNWVSELQKLDLDIKPFQTGQLVPHKKQAHMVCSPLCKLILLCLEVQFCE